MRSDYMKTINLEFHYLEITGCSSFAADFLAVFASGFSQQSKNITTNYIRQHIDGTPRRNSSYYVLM